MLSVKKITTVALDTKNCLFIEKIHNKRTRREKQNKIKQYNDGHNQLFWLYDIFGESLRYLTASSNNKLSYRKQVAHRLRTWYFEGIYGNSATLKCMLGVTEGR